MSSDLILGAILGAGAFYLYGKRRGGSLNGFVVEAKRRSSSDPETGGWSPGWRKAGTYRSRSEAETFIKKRGLRGAKYRISLDGCGCD